MKRDFGRLLVDLLSVEVVVVLSVVWVGILVYRDRNKYIEIGKQEANEKLFLIVKAFAFVIVVIAAIRVIFFVQ